MDAAHATVDVDATGPDLAVVPVVPAAVLRGTSKGLEIHVDGHASADAIAAAVVKRLDEAPGFFRGSDVRIKVEDGPLAPGTLGKLDEIAEMFELRIVEVGAVKKPALVASPAAEIDAVPQPDRLAAGSVPAPVPVLAAPLPPADDEPTLLVVPVVEAAPVVTPAEPVQLAPADVAELVSLVAAPNLAAPQAAPTQAAAPELEEPVATGPRLVVGPVRSGVILEHQGHLIVFGDVNPGAEIRATGNIVVLGRLRGTAHAGIGQDVGFILALRLEPQQLRVGRKVARAADSDTPGTEAEIASCTGDAIVVERYLGKLPKNLATSL